MGKKAVHLCHDAALFWNGRDKDLSFFHGALGDMDHRRSRPLILFDLLFVPEQKHVKEFLVDYGLIRNNFPNMVMKNYFPAGPDSRAKRSRPSVKKVSIVAVLFGL